MSLTVDPRSPLAMAHLAADHPGEAAHLTPGYQALSPSDRRRIDELVDEADRDLGASVVGLLRCRGFVEATVDGRAALVRALLQAPTVASAARLQLLAEDVGFSFLHGAEAREQADLTVRRAAVPEPDQLAHRAGAARPGHSAHGLLQWAELGLHVIEGIEAAEVFHGAAHLVMAEVGLSAGLVVLPLALIGGLHEIARAHEAGAAWRGAVQYGHGYVSQLEAELRGEDRPGVPRGREAEGATRARTLWETLAPSERVALREVATDDFLASLRRCVERITVAGERSAR